MREIKFRAWDKRNKVMLHSKELDGFFKVFPGSENEILMQYTGLKDKNGKEIYEGDILKDTLDNLYIVDFIRGCFYLKTRYEKNGEWLEWLPMSEITQLAEPENFYRIGNIYENPELLA